MSRKQQENVWLKKGNPLSTPKIIPIADVRFQQSDRSNLDLRVSESSEPKIFDLNRKLLKLIFNHLDTISLARSSRVCRRFNNTINSLVENLEVNVVWDEDDHENQIVHHDNTNKDNKQVTLIHCAPKDFFYPHPAFKFIKQLYLCFEDMQGDIIDLTKYRQLKYLKIRGANIQLSANRLPSITHLDIDDPDSLQRQVARNLKNFHLEVDLETLSNFHNATELKMVEYVFTKSLDILLDKPNIEQISFTISMVNMDLLIFEKMVDSLDTFLRKFEEEIHRGFVSLLFKHSTNYERDGRRWENAWRYLEETLEQNHPEFSVDVEELGDEYNIPVI